MVHVSEHTDLLWADSDWERLGALSYTPEGLLTRRTPPRRSFGTSRQLSGTEFFRTSLNAFAPSQPRSRCPNRLATHFDWILSPHRLL